MKNIKYIIPLLLVVIALSGCTSNKPKTQVNTEVKNQPVVENKTELKEEKKIDMPVINEKGILVEKDENIFKNNEKYKGSIIGLFKNKIGIKCTTEDTKQSVTTTLYLDGKTERMRLDTVVGKNTIYSLKTDDKNMYVWNNLNQGAKADKSLQDMSYNSKMIYQDCSEWTVDESILKVPESIKFTEDIYTVIGILNNK